MIDIDKEFEKLTLKLDKKTELEELTIFISSNKVDYCPATILIDPITTGLLYFESKCGLVNKISAYDLFDCLIELRDWLSEKSIIILCNGARLDVFPSGMSRQSTNGRLAYKHKLNMQCNGDDLVDIFEFSAIETIGTTLQQNEFYNKWIKSL